MQWILNQTGAQTAMEQTAKFSGAVAIGAVGLLSLQFARDWYNETGRFRDTSLKGQYLGRLRAVRETISRRVSKRVVRQDLLDNLVGQIAKVIMLRGETARLMVLGTKNCGKTTLLGQMMDQVMKGKYANPRKWFWSPTAPEEKSQEAKTAGGLVSNAKPVLEAGFIHYTIESVHQIGVLRQEIDSLFPPDTEQESAGEALREIRWEFEGRGKQLILVVSINTNFDKVFTNAVYDIVCTKFQNMGIPVIVETSLNARIFGKSGLGWETFFVPEFEAHQVAEFAGLFKVAEDDALFNRTSGNVGLMLTFLYSQTEFDEQMEMMETRIQLSLNLFPDITKLVIDKLKKKKELGKDMTVALTGEQFDQSFGREWPVWCNVSKEYATYNLVIADARVGLVLESF